MRRTPQSHREFCGLVDKLSAHELGVRWLESGCHRKNSDPSNNGAYSAIRRGEYLEVTVENRTLIKQLQQYRYIHIYYHN